MHCHRAGHIKLFVKTSKLALTRVCDYLPPSIEFFVRILPKTRQVIVNFYRTYYISHRQGVNTEEVLLNIGYVIHQLLASVLTLCLWDITIACLAFAICCMLSKKIHYYLFCISTILS